MKSKPSYPLQSLPPILHSNTLLQNSTLSFELIDHLRWLPVYFFATNISRRIEHAESSKVMLFRKMMAMAKKLDSSAVRSLLSEVDNYMFDCDGE